MTLATTVLLGVVSCGGGGGEAEDESANASSEREQASTSGAIEPCGLLSAAQVATVLTDADDGFVAKAGGSLIDGVDSYQCSYSNPEADLFTVIVTVAVDDERFEDIERDPSIQRDIYSDTFREVDVGDSAWLAGTPDDTKLTAIVGRAVVDLNLMTADAGKKADALVALGNAVVSRIR
jgi:hypothetical protein